MLWCGARVELATWHIRSRASSTEDCMRSREVESPGGGIEHIPARTSWGRLCAGWRLGLSQLYFYKFYYLFHIL
jgi:hypothetical protein